MLLPEGTYTVLANAFGYETAAVPGVVIVQDETTTVDFTLEALPRFTVSGDVTAAENGRPLANVTVRAVGTPVEPATTNRKGHYSLVLPVGTYTLEASQGGCLEVGTAEVEVTEDVEVDFALGRKLDHFGHGCKPIPFKWGNAADQTALFGDDVYGRLLLPEAVSFYGVDYEELFIGSNGHVGYLDPFFSSPLPHRDPRSRDPERRGLRAVAGPGRRRPGDGQLRVQALGRRLVGDDRVPRRLSLRRQWGGRLPDQGVRQRRHRDPLGRRCRRPGRRHPRHHRDRERRGRRRPPVRVPRAGGLLGHRDPLRGHGRRHHHGGRDQRQRRLARRGRERRGVAGRTERRHGRRRTVHPEGDQRDATR